MEKLTKQEQKRMLEDSLCCNFRAYVPMIFKYEAHKEYWDKMPEPQNFAQQILDKICCLIEFWNSDGYTPSPETESTAGLLSAINWLHDHDCLLPRTFDKFLDEESDEEEYENLLLQLCDYWTYEPRLIECSKMGLQD